MNEYETEEQQIEALKKWWKENSSSLIFGLLVGVTALFGWRYYLDQNHIHAVQASDLYVLVLQSTASGTVDDKTIDLHNQLLNNYTDTPYAALSSLVLAKTEYEKGNTDAALTQLELAVKYAADEETKQIANLRLARVYIEQKNYEQASAALNTPHEAAFEAQYEELKGDLFVAKGETAQARMAYDRALELQGFSASKWLKLKRQNLGDATDSTDLGNLAEEVKAAV